MSDPKPPVESRDPEIKVVDRRWWVQPEGETSAPESGETDARVGPRKPTYVEDLETDLAQAKLLIQGEIDSYKLEKRYMKKDGEITGTIPINFGSFWGENQRLQADRDDLIERWYADKVPGNK